MRRDSPRYGSFPKRRKSRERPWNRASPAFGKLWEHAGKCRVDLCDIIEENICNYGENIATDDKQIRKDVALVKSYIKAHLSEKINLESLADMVFLSPGYLSLIFKQSTGDTVSHYIISKRIDEAKRLLETTNMKVNQICEKVGIDNVSYFGQRFKMFCGMSPSEYRKRKKYGVR